MARSPEVSNAVPLYESTAEQDRIRAISAHVREGVEARRRITPPHLRTEPFAVWCRRFFGPNNRGRRILLSAACGEMKLEKSQMWALNRIMEHGYGRPKERVELSNPDGALRTIAVVYSQDWRTPEVVQAPAIEAEVREIAAGDNGQDSPTSPALSAARGASKPSAP